MDIGEVERLLDLAARGDTDGVLDLWSAWIDSIRDRIRAVDARLNELATRPAMVIEVVAAPAPPEPEPAREPEPKPDPEPVLEPESETATLPEGELGELLATTYDTLARLPAGTMKRQLKSQLEALRTEALNDGTIRSLKPRLATIQREIDELLEVIG